MSLWLVDVRSACFILHNRHLPEPARFSRLVYLFCIVRLVHIVYRQAACVTRWCSDRCRNGSARSWYAANSQYGGSVSAANGVHESDGNVDGRCAVTPAFATRGVCESTRLRSTHRSNFAELCDDRIWHHLPAYGDGVAAFEKRE